MASESLAHQDWTRCELGPPAAWPHSLRLTVDIMLNTPLPMLLVWGRQQLMLFNQAYVTLAGNSSAVPPGGAVPAIPPSAWSWNPQAIASAWDGHSQHFARQHLPLWRGGQIQHSLFDLHYTPVSGDDGKVAGILCTLAPPSAAAAPDAGADALRILVVEDNLDAQYLVCEMLRAFGHTVEAVASGEQALERLQQHGFDVLFSDVSLPGMSGIDLGRAALRLHPALRIVFASGYSQSLTAHLDFPAIAMQKPYEIEQLQQVLQQLR